MSERDPSRTTGLEWERSRSSEKENHCYQRKEKLSYGSKDVHYTKVSENEEMRGCLGMLKELFIPDDYLDMEDERKSHWRADDKI